MAFLDITIKNNSIHDCNLTRIKFLIKEHTAFYYDPDPCPTCLKHSFSATYNISLENIKRNDVPEYGISNSIIPWGTERIGLLLGGQKLSYHSKFSIAFKYNREFEVESDVIEIIALNGQYNGIEKQKYILNDTLMYTGYHDFPSSILLRDSINKMIENNAVPIINQKMLKDILEPKSKSYHKLEEGWKKDKYSQIIDSLFKEK